LLSQDLFYISCIPPTKVGWMEANFTDQRTERWEIGGAGGLHFRYLKEIQVGDSFKETGFNLIARSRWSPRVLLALAAFAVLLEFWISGAGLRWLSLAFGAVASLVMAYSTVWVERQVFGPVDAEQLDRWSNTFENIAILLWALVAGTVMDLAARLGDGWHHALVS
jgi:hypothetical protein